MRPSRKIAVVSLLLLSAPGCASLGSRTGWTDTSGAAPETGVASRWPGSRWWSRTASPASPASEPDKALAPELQAARKVAPESEIWPSPSAPRLTRRFSLLGLRQQDQASASTGGTWPVKGGEAVPATPSIPGDRDLRTVAAETTRPKPHERPQAGGNVVLDVEAEAADLADQESAATRPLRELDPARALALDTGPRPDLPARPRLETQLVPAGITADEPASPAADDPQTKGATQKPATGDPGPPPPIDEPAPKPQNRPAQAPRTKPARPSTTAPQPTTPGTRRPAQPSPAMEGQRTTPPARPVRPSTPPATTPRAEPVPAPAPTPPIETPAETRPAAPAPQPQPQPTSPPVAEPVPAPEPVPAEQPAATGQPQAVVPSPQAGPAAGPSCDHEPAGHRRFSLLGWLQARHAHAAGPEQPCSLPPATFPTTYRTAMPAPQAAPAPPPAPVPPAAHAQAAPVASSCKPCGSWSHKGMFSCAIEKLRACDKLKPWRWGCKCPCHKAVKKAGCASCKPCSKGGPCASEQSPGPEAFRAGPAAGGPLAGDVAQGAQVLERIAAEGLDKPSQR